MGGQDRDEDGEFRGGVRAQLDGIEKAIKEMRLEIHEMRTSGGQLSTSVVSLKTQVKILWFVAGGLASALLKLFFDLAVSAAVAS